MSDAPLPSSFDDDPDFFDENRFRKFFKRFKDEPLVPLGVGLTCWAFYNAQQSIRTGNSIRTNRFFRYRLYAQAFTLVAMIGGSIYYRSDRMKRTEYTKLKEKQKKQEKREKWIKELEARDREDSEWRAKLGKVQDLQREEEDRAMVAQAKQKRLQAQDDGKSVMKEIQKEVKKKGEKAAGGVAEPVEPPVPGEKQTDKSKYEPYLGEREEGGLFGYKYIGGFYEHRLKPFAENIMPKKKEQESTSEDKKAPNLEEKASKEELKVLKEEEKVLKEEAKALKQEAKAPKEEESKK